MKKLTFIILAIYCTNISAQEANSLLMEYNIYTNVVTYSVNGEYIQTPVVDEGKNIYIKLIEFNPYTMKTDLIIKDDNYNQTTGEFTGGGGLGPTNNGGLSGISNLLGGLNMGANIQETFGGIPGSRGAVSEAMTASKNEFNVLTAELSYIENKINLSANKIKLFKTTAQSQNLATSDIEKLKTNTYLKPSRIKELIEEEINYSFAKAKGEEITISDLVNEMQKEEDLKKTIDSYNNATKDYKDLAKKWANFSNSLSFLTQQVNDLQLEFIIKSTDSISQTIKSNIESNLTQSLDISLTDEYTKDNIATMASLRQVYEEMQSNIFTYSFPPIQANGEQVVIDLEVLSKNQLGEYKTLKNLKQNITVTGGWKISAGVGLSFGALANKSYDYSVVNGVIIEDEIDDFIPFITSFAHFHQKNNNNLNLGGSFGIGFPLQGGASVQSVTFFIGPTLLLGKKQKFLLTAGIMGANVGRLGSGLKAGDEYNSFTNTLPIKQKYELGYFIGISYDILK